jgi:mRNA interferase RelE/StbE
VTYTVRIKASALKSLERIRREDRLRIIEAIDRLAEEPHAGTLLKGEFDGLRCLRVGRYRVIYEIYEGELTVLVIRVSHRKNAYR